MYDFAKHTEGLVRDATGGRQHARVNGKSAYIQGLTGPAFVFDGRVSLTTQTSQRLAMTSQLTLDVWLRIDKAGDHGCVLDKGGERYRIAVTSDGRVHFGLKSGKARADLHGGRLVPGRWHRITATFKRPTLTIYLDGLKAATRKWDRDVGPGGNLFLGAKAGRYNHFHGAVDQVRIYDYARPPRPGDPKRVFGVTAAQQEAKLMMTESRGVVNVDTGAMQFKLDARRGILRSLVLAGKTLIRDNRAPLLFATLMESAAYDGVQDFVPRKFIQARYTCEGLRARTTAGGFQATGKGTLAFPGGDAIDFRLGIEAEEGASRLKISVALTRRGAFKNRFIREVGLSQPLALKHRKRVVQAADQGLRWDTRYRYQFHMHVRFLPQPDHNWWRHFYVDQQTAHSYAIWRAESADTSALYAFRGRKAPGWMTIYDPEGGALFAYRQLSARAPKCLYAHADAGGRGVVYFHGPTHAALDPRDSARSRAVFGKPHEIDWIFFAGEECFEQPDRRLAETWGVKFLSSDGPPKHETVDHEVDLWDAPAARKNTVPLVMGGIPLPRGAITRPDQTRLFVRGKEAPMQGRILGYWPDRSIKWLQLLFPQDGSGGYDFAAGAGRGDEVAFHVTLRKGKPVPCSLRFGKKVQAGRISTLMRIRREGGTVKIATGPLALSLTQGERWLSSAVLHGREMIRDDGRPQAHVDFVRTRKDYPVGTTHPEGAPDPGPVRIESLDVEEDGPLRAVVRLEGRALAKEPARVIIRIEAYAGRSFVHLTHSVEFLHKDPRRAFVRSMGLRLPLALNKTGRRLAAGGQQGPVALKPAALTGLRQTSHLNYEVWQTRGGARHRVIRDSAWRSRGWLDVADGRGGLAVIERDMWQEFPKELSFRHEDGAFEIGLWPASAPLMDVRRYSNYPHRAQGESTPVDVRWVMDRYYKNDPFVGVSKTHDMLLFFHGADVSPERVDTVAADFQSRPLVYAGWSWYAKTGITIPQIGPADPKFKRSAANMNNVADWWLFHQRAWGWYGMWDHGDVGHRFRGGYGRVFPPETLAKILEMPPEERLKVDLRKIEQKFDYFTQNDWAFDNGRWGWSNTEGLPNLFMSTQYLRTGRRDLFFFMEANARHVRDVDARHAGKWFGAGTRHGVQHWSDGNHEERQTTFTEQRFHYFLTGDPRTREWNQVLANTSYLQGKCRVHADHSGRSYGLLVRWEITGDPKLGETLRNYMHAFAQPEGIDVSAPVQFPQGTAYGKPREINSDTMFFHTFGAMHALLEYYNLTKDKRVRDSIVKMADHALSRGPRAVGGYLRKAVAFAARHAPKGAKYRKALREWVAGRGYRYVFQQVPANRAHWTGETAFLVGNVSGGMFWINDAAYVLGALEAEPKLSPAAETQIKALEERPVFAPPRMPRGSWQTEYDRPEFLKYLQETLRPVEK